MSAAENVQVIDVLLVEDDAGDVLLIEELFSKIILQNAWK